MQKKTKKLNKKTAYGSVVIPSERVVSKIFLIRGKKVMLDRDLAVLYGVATGALNRAVKRNIKRFPSDFMFQLNEKESEDFSRYQFGILNTRSQIVTLKKGRGYNIKYLSYAFTEQGVAMLSSVLRSERAIQTNIQIMRTFTNLREMLATNKELREKINRMERRYDQNFKIIFQTIQSFLKAEKEPKKQIGFRR